MGTFKKCLIPKTAECGNLLLDLLDVIEFSMAKPNTWHNNSISDRIMHRKMFTYDIWKPILNSPITWQNAASQASNASQSS